MIKGWLYRVLINLRFDVSRILLTIQEKQTLKTYVTMNNGLIMKKKNNSI